MNKLRHGVAAMAILVALVTLFINVNENINENYGLSNSDIQTTSTGEELTIMERLDKLTIRQGISQVATAMQQLASPGASLADIAGALISVGIGAIKTILGLVLIPGQIIGIVIGFYDGTIPGWIEALIINLVVIYAAFIFLSSHLGKEV